jgi:hypothetical protein
MPKKSKWEEFQDLFRPGKTLAWRLRNLENMFDDGIDDIKHKLHGAEIFGYKIHLPDWLMKGKGDPDK